jgi:D-ribose pyranase
VKKTTLLHSELSKMIATLGHGDRVVIADAGFPIPRAVQRIDLAVTRGIPSIEQVLRATLSEMHVERVVLANETKAHCTPLLTLLDELLPSAPVEWVSHDALKALSHSATTIVRTGECTPYANVVLVSGVVF